MHGRDGALRRPRIWRQRFRAVRGSRDCGTASLPGSGVNAKARVILSRADGEGPHNCSRIIQTRTVDVRRLDCANRASVFSVIISASVRSALLPGRDPGLRQPRDDTRLVFTRKVGRAAALRHPRIAINLCMQTRGRRSAPSLPRGCNWNNLVTFLTC